VIANEIGESKSMTANQIEAGGPANGPGFEGYIDKKECARRLGRTPRSVDTYMALGMVPFYKLGRTVAFKWSEVDAHIKAHYRVGLRG
jgi:predicted DNA-binding transcriptional regulator AlpA